MFQTRVSVASLHAALRALRPQGSVIDFAFYQGGSEALRLGDEFRHNGLNIRCAQIGRVPRGMALLWDRARLSQETVVLLAARGAEIKAQIITHIVLIEEANGFLRHLVADRPGVLQFVFKVAA